tara:strand:- start:57 stop:539 length:483 start_codon:yes stop_codon:yes gene_type:complete
MKITNEQLKQIIKEELETVMESYGASKRPAPQMSKFQIQQSRENSIESIKRRTMRHATNRLVDILDNNLGLFGDDIDNMMKKNPIQFDNSKFYKLEDLTEAVVENTFKSLDKDSIKRGDDKELGGGIAVDIFKLIRPLVNKNRSFMQKAGSFLTGKGFKQ